nr:DnaD domain-containing protein [Tuberibacillus calidus]
MMEKETLIEFMTKGHVTIPRLLLDYYSQIGLNEEECLLVIQLFALIHAGHPFPTPDELAEKMTFSSVKCADHLRRLVQKGMLEIVQDREGPVYSERYSLDRLWGKLAEAYILNQKNDQQLAEEEALYTIFEKEFGRPLSPIECETLAMWIDDDHHSPEMIKAALREAVLSGKLNFRYIDRILFDWKKNGVKTLEQAKAHGEKIRGRYASRKKVEDDGQSKTIQFPLYNWLEN